MTVRAVRGATTVENNDAVEILNETRNLLEQIMEINNFQTEDLISAFFTVTKDINAAFPAVAARQIGWTDIALMCANEIDIPGSLKKCIRVMVHVNTQKTNAEIKNVYLKNAKVLRPDLENS